MELNKISIEFKDLKPAVTNQSTMADVVVIDRTNVNAEASVYILKNQDRLEEIDFKLIENGFIQLKKDAFILVGYLDFLNKSTKQVVLTNENIVLYKHLVLVAGPQDALLSFEFLAGVQTLVDALRMRSKIPSSFGKTVASKTDEQNLCHKSAQKELTSSQPKVEKLSSENIHPQKADSSALESTKRLYEVQL